MSKITKIFMENVKGNTTEQELTGKDIFIGRNGIGKTARLQALATTMLGYVPEKNSKELLSTFELSSGEAMTVGLTVESGFECRRTFKRHVTNKRTGGKEVKIIQEVDVAPLTNEKTNTQKIERIKYELGSFPVMLDISEFTKKNSTERRNFFYSLLKGIPGACLWDKDKVDEYLKKHLLTEELKNNDVDHYNTMERSIADLMKKFPTGDIQEAISISLDYATGRRSFWTSERERLEKTVQTLTDSKNKSGVTDRDLAANKKSLEQMNTQLIELEKTLAANNEKNKAIDEVIDAIMVLKKDIEDIKAEKPTDNANELRKLIKAEEEKINGTDFSKEIEALTNNITSHKQALTKAEDEFKKVTEKGVQYKTQIESLEKLVGKVRQHKGKCGIDSKIPCSQDFTGFFKEVDEEIAGIRKAQDGIREEYKEKELAVRRFKKAIADRELQKDNLVKQERGIVSANKVIADTIKKLQARLEAVLTFDQVKKAKLDGKVSELKALEAKPQQYFETDTLSLQIDVMKFERDEIKSLVELQDGIKVTTANLKAAELELTTATYNEMCYKYIVEMLGTKGLKGQIVKDMLDPIKNDIQANLQDLGVTNEFFFNTKNEYGEEVFQFGWINENGGSVQFDALSTGQRMLLLMALSLTFIEAANPDVKVLALDNIENIDKESRKQVFKGLGAISQKVDNILIGTCILADDIPQELLEAGFKVWDIAKLNQASASGKTVMTA